MTNLLRETIEDIERSGHTPDDIVFIGSKDGEYSCTWEEFKRLADQEYDDGFGAQEVACDLIIVFQDGTNMWRHEYDGAECWRYSIKFKMPEETKSIKRLFANGVGWEPLDEIHRYMAE